MAKGFQDHRNRLAALNYFGKDLARRSGSKCELCGAGGPLQAYELPPAPAEPDFYRCAFLCGDCADAIGSPQRANAERWRCLNNSVWSEVPAVQALAVRLLRDLSKSEPWAAELLEQVYLDPEVGELAG